jgi:hypothetical protein
MNPCPLPRRPVQLFGARAPGGTRLLTSSGGKLLDLIHPFSAARPVEHFGRYADGATATLTGDSPLPSTTVPREAGDDRGSRGPPRSRSASAAVISVAASPVA